MTDYEQLVKALRECASDDPDCIYNCPYYNHDVCADDLKSDAAAAIEALQAEVKRLVADVDAAYLKSSSAQPTLSEKPMRTSKYTRIYKRLLMW